MQTLEFQQDGIIRYNMITNSDFVCYEGTIIVYELTDIVLCAIFFVPYFLLHVIALSNMEHWIGLLV